MTAAQCRDKYMKWEVGLSNGTSYTRCKSAGSTDCNVIGDIYHSTPRLVGRPGEFLRDESYQVFAESDRVEEFLGVSGCLPGILAPPSDPPEVVLRLAVRDVDTMVDAIRRLAVRGAPAIGVAAAYGVLLGVQDMLSAAPADVLEHTKRTAETLAKARPTAVNLFWALAQMRNTLRVALETHTRDTGASVLELAVEALDAAVVTGPANPFAQ